MSDDEILYHYCSNDTFLKVVENRTLRFSSLGVTNDTKEGRYLLERIRDRLVERDLLTASEVAEFNSTMEESSGLAFCLSRASNDLNQWTTYGDGGQGVAIGIRRSMLEMMAKQLKNVFLFEIVDVQYGTEVLDGLVEGAVSLIENKGRVNADYKELSLTDLLELGVAILYMWAVIKSVYSFKDEKFRHESEVRLLSVSFNGEDVARLLPIDIEKGKSRHSSYVQSSVSQGMLSKANVIYPFIDCEVPDNIGGFIEEITLGPKNGSNIREIRNWLRSRGYGEVKITRSEIPYR